MLTTLDAAAREAFSQDSKVGLLATRTEDGQPHLSLITTLDSRSPTELIWGQFCEGLSKQHVKRDPRVGFLVMTMDRRYWRGKASWTRARQDGPEYELFNHKPLFRYNAYFGVHTAHYMDLLEVSAGDSLALGGIAVGTLAAGAARLWNARPRGPAVLKPFARALLSRPDTLKFLAHLDEDGHPVVIPVVPAMAASAHRMLIVGSVFRRELAAIPPGSRVALFGLNLKMESVLVRGTWQPGRLRLGGLSPYRLELDYVYNSMPPVPGQIYPPLPLESVRDFD